MLTLAPKVSTHFDSIDCEVYGQSNTRTQYGNLVTKNSEGEGTLCYAEPGVPFVAKLFNMCS